MYFATIHKESALLLGDIAHQIGQRAFVGKVSMDQNSPDYYIEEKSSAIKEIEDFITTLQSKNVKKNLTAVLNYCKLYSLFFQYPNVQPVITPRFAITCSMELMKNLSELASKYNVNIQVRKIVLFIQIKSADVTRSFLKFQTHVSENPAECEVAVSLHEGCRDYVDIYAQANLLTAKVIFRFFILSCIDLVNHFFLDYSCPWDLFVG